MNIEKLFEQAKNDKNTKALVHLQYAALHLQLYEIASELKNEISKLNIAVKVDNESEFNALMHFLGRKINVMGWHEFPKCVRLDNLGYSESSGNKDAVYEILKHVKKVISFTDFVKENNIKFPIFKTHDGIDIYDGDNFYMVEDLKLSEWDVNPFTKNTDKQTFTAANGFSDLLGKPFSTRKAALEWIEAQKLKEIELPLTNFINAIVTKEKVVFRMDEQKYSPQFLDKEHVKSIIKAMNELS